MAQCFCGCGRKVKFGARSINKRGKIIRADVRQIEMLLDGGMQSPNAEQFAHDGLALCGVLADAVHLGMDPGPEVESETRGFMAFSRENFGTAAFGRQIRQRGLSSDQAVAEVAAGEWDPFADVEMP
jgi:hypothetical protein